MTDDQDNAGEVVAGAVRVALIAAGQLAEQAARRREADLREAERDSAARVATMQSQLAAERELALRSVRGVVQRGDAASVDELVPAWERARSWDDPHMATERAHLEDSIRERFAVDASSLAADRSSGAQATAAGVVMRDIELQAQDERHRVSSQGWVDGQHPEQQSPEIDDEAFKARALAARSHPTPVTHAAQTPGKPSTARTRQANRVRVAEIQGRAR